MKLLQVSKLVKDALLPTKAHKNDACFDIFSNEELFIPQGMTRKIKTGISICLPPGYMIKFFDRSSLSIKGLILGGGVIDPDFSGELCVILHNFSALSELGEIKDEKLDMGYRIDKGAKIAQFAIMQIEYPEIMEVNKIPSIGRGDKGFGSSGA